jgi:predicted PurR-regulated permease PerM
MALTEKDTKKILFVTLLVLLAILAFFIVKPVLLSVLGGLILAYLFLPVHKFLVKYLKSPLLSAIIVSTLLLAIIILSLWFLLPLISQEVFSLYKGSQQLDLTSLMQTIFPSASEQFISQVDLTVGNALNKVTSSIISSMVNLLLNFATVSLQLLLVAFVFFFSLKDADKLKSFASGLLPLHRTQEIKLSQQFEDITKSILYGQIVAGSIQGLLAALALYLFHIPNALFLSFLAFILSILPVIGPGFIYVPVTIYLIVSGNPLAAIGFFLFNIIIVSPIESLFRAHFVSKKTNLSQAIVLIGMIGGIFMFSVLGLIIGPLVFAYVITFLRAYKDKTISSFFES